MGMDSQQISYGQLHIYIFSTILLYIIFVTFLISMSLFTIFINDILCFHIFLFSSI